MKEQRKRRFGYLQVLDRRHIVATLVLHGWNRAAASRALGISRSALDQKCTLYTLEDLWPHPKSSAVREQEQAAKRAARRRPKSAQSEAANRKRSERRATIEEMLASGATYQQIGHKFGICRERVRQLCNSLALDRHQGRRARRATAELKKIRRWRENVSWEVAAVIAWFDELCISTTPRGRARFEAAGLTFCVHSAPRACHTAGYSRYYHGRGTCRLDTDCIVLVTGDGRRFVIPQSHWGVSVYIPDSDDGRWAGFRDRWPASVLGARTA